MFVSRTRKITKIVATQHDLVATEETFSFVHFDICEAIGWALILLFLVPIE